MYKGGLLVRAKQLHTPGETTLSLGKTTPGEQDIGRNDHNSSLLAQKMIALVLLSFMVTDHRLAQSDIDHKSLLSLEAQSPGDLTFFSKKQS